jgi:replicative DNA helicase
MYFSPEEKETKADLLGLAEVIVAKQRNGPTGHLTLAFQNKFAKFENLEIARGGSET